MTKGFAILGAVTIALLLGGTGGYIYTHQNSDPYAQCGGGQIGAEIGGAFTLLDSKGNAITDKELFSKPALVYFGYTFCPDVCPLDNARNVEAVDILEERGMDVTPVFITIDPERDTPEVMGEYAQNMHPKMIGLSGSPEQVKTASQAFKTYYRKQPSDDEFYLMDHSTFTYLMLPNTGFAGFFRREETADQVADRIGCFLG